MQVLLGTICFQLLHMMLIDAAIINIGEREYIGHEMVSQISLIVKLYK
ncbi:hypothetical protein T12_9853 [Trichinella patagoniensis]|uniref:Uncharacterized protein n=1 Tax=Trichinella patagoniensis TaxID=990121 RepID=A0A0V1AG10_9BILA|nr:hypothetical protein T12_9853 [Trichinella patagoniensis]